MIRKWSAFDFCHWRMAKHNYHFDANFPITIQFYHYNDVIMTTIASQITSLTFVYSIDYSSADQRKHQSSVPLAFVWGIHRDRWIPRTKSQWRSDAENVSIWWRHHDPNTFNSVINISVVILPYYILRGLYIHNLGMRGGECDYHRRQKYFHYVFLIW